MITGRCCGVLLHPTSLPGSGGIGTLGANARRFIDLLHEMGMSLWQVLPLTPPACGNSPYSAFSAFAGNPLLLDLDQLVDEGDLPHDYQKRNYPENKVDFPSVEKYKLVLLRQAAESFFSAGGTTRMEEFWRFCDSTGWLHDYALFMALKRRYKNKSWQQWPQNIALLKQEAYEKISEELGQEIGLHKYMQWQFHRQWHALRAYANTKGIRIFGDIPIFVAHDSVDVWRNRNIFLLNEKGAPTVVAGVPPDYFSSTGQLWGNPLYDWGVLEQQDYGWWIERFRQIFILFDGVRIDHFRGFEAAWHVPAGDPTAEHGKWVKGPGSKIFDALVAALGSVPVIAEDLGAITPEVEALLEYCGYPGMKILQFAFDSGSDNPYLPHNHKRNCVVYTGTHDNNTTVGWYEAISPALRHEAREYIGCENSDIAGGMLRMALMSVADTAIIPFQDLLGLPSEARMNLPGTVEGNWEWRFSWNMIPRNTGTVMAEMVERYGRTRKKNQ